MALDDIEAILRDEERFRTVAKEAFGQVDTDGAGAIDKTELKNAMTSFTEKIGTSAPNDSDVEEALKTFNTSQDSKITLEEFIKFFKDFLEEIAND